MTQLNTEICELNSDDLDQVAGGYVYPHAGYPQPNTPHPEPESYWLLLVNSGRNRQNFDTFRQLF